MGLQVKPDREEHYSVIIVRMVGGGDGGWGVWEGLENIARITVWMYPKVLLCTSNYTGRRCGAQPRSWDRQSSCFVY